jgi:uncharacterized protein YjbI with pentapeptide repeats
MSKEESAKQQAHNEAGPDGGCRIGMWSGKPCGRPIYRLAGGSRPDEDSQPVCLIHSRHPAKDNAAFQREFERILQEAGEGEADFSLFVFPNSDYPRREFMARCIFAWATFAQGASFMGATFTQKANFRGSTFTQGADFSGATFTQKASFTVATFTQVADFSEATFTQEADFMVATFTRAADFRKTTFTEAADFREAVFQAGVRFRETEFRNDGTREAGPAFSEATFAKPEAVTFYKCYLGQALFHNCDVSKFVFSVVRWRKRSNGKSVVFEEGVKVGGKDYLFAEALRPGEGDADERNYTLIAELYQQLKKNYDDRRDYWTAGDFHYGEMEMKRLHSASRHPWVRWLHRYTGLAAWYKYASGYGESYVRPFVMLCAVILLFALLYPLAGLRWQPGNARAEAGERQSASDSAANGGASAKSEDAHLPVIYWDFGEFLSRDSKGNMHGSLACFGHSLMTTLYVAAFQKNLEYQPSYPWGRLLALVEVVVTSTLIALFLLAVRRQFRR